MKLQGQEAHLAAAWIASLVLLSSCRGPEGEGQGPPEVVNSAPAPGSVLEATEIFRIGRSQGEGPDVFGRIDVLAVDPRGNLYLVDGLANEIRVFGANGEHRASFGREGEGPGEFNGVRGVAFHPDGTVWVWDHSLQRFSVFDTTGSLVRNVRRVWTAIVTPWPGQFDREGRLLDLAIEHRGLDLESTVTKEIQTVLTPIRFDGEMRILDSLPPLVARLTAWKGRFRVPFEGGRVWTLEPDGSGWFTDGHAYRILRREANGDTVLAFSLDLEPPRVTQVELDSVLQSMSGWPPDQALDPSVIPDTRASVDRLVRLAPGWLGAFPHLAAETGQILDVFTAAGTHRARIGLGIALSLTSPAPFCRNGILFGMVRDEMDVQYVVALDLGLDELRGDASPLPDG